MIGAGNGTGPVETRVSRERDFEIFDSLPPEVRHAMNYTVFPYQARETAIQMRRLGADKVAAMYAGGWVDALTIKKEREAEELKARLKEVLHARAA